MTYPPARTFWMEPTDHVAWGLRRHVSGSTDFHCAGGYHDALSYIGRAEANRTERLLKTHQSGIAPDDLRWPSTCQHGCGYQFTPDDHFQDWSELIYRRPDTGQEYMLHASGAPELGAPSAPPGAMWDAWWMPYSRGADGICLVVRLPNGRDWMVDSQASNCTRPSEQHQCWVRHGDPRTQPVTVDKNGDTCAAGAGSILSADYHGFLQAGILTAG